MLSRVANAIYWMSRYLERAGNLARVVEVNWHLTLDLPGSGATEWRSLIEASGDLALFEEHYGEYDAATVITFLSFDRDYPNSIASCLWAARENARAIREVIPYEMWNYINMFYHIVHDAATRPLQVVENPFSFCQEVKMRDFMLGGITADAMIEDEAWHFARLGRLLERCDKTSRILDVSFQQLLQGNFFRVVRFSLGALTLAQAEFRPFAAFQTGPLLPGLFHRRQQLLGLIG